MQAKLCALFAVAFLAINIFGTLEIEAQDTKTAAPQKPKAKDKTKEKPKASVSDNSETETTAEQSSSDDGKEGSSEDPARPNPRSSEDPGSGVPSNESLAKNSTADLKSAINDLTAELKSLRDDIKAAKNINKRDSQGDGAGQAIPVDPPTDDDTTAPESRKGLVTAAAEADSGNHVLASSISDPIRVKVSARKIHLIHFALTNDPTEQLDQGSRANITFLNALFTKMTENCKDRLSITTVSGDNLTTAKVETTLSNLSDVTKQDTLVVYFSTHGGFDPNRNEHFFQTMNRGLYSRKRVWDKINGKARLVAVFSDACTTMLSVPRSIAGIEDLSAPKETYALFDLLFFYQGTVNISSSTYPNPSYYINTNSANGGGAFTRQFVNAAVYAPTVKDSVGQSQGWKRFFNDNLKGQKPLVTDPRGNEVPTWFLFP